MTTRSKLESRNLSQHFMSSEPVPSQQPAAQYIERGSATFWRSVVALFTSGFSTFSLLYYVQPILPTFAQDFHISPATSSLILSMSTTLLAASMLAASVVSDSLGRRKIMTASIVASSCLTVLIAALPDWHVLLVSRALLGITISGLPAVAMAYMGEEMEPRALGLAMGLYIAGSAIGGMGGRLLGGVIASDFGWRMAALAIGLLGFCCAALFWKLLPPSRNFRPRALDVRAARERFRGHLRDPLMLRLFAQGFIVMGTFVAVYNYIGFRLLGAPFHVSSAVVGLVSITYLAGVVSPPWLGALAPRFGHARMLGLAMLSFLAGVLLLLSHNIWVVVIGMTAITFGFFGAHSLTSSGVARNAKQGRGQASALYLFCYYCGSSIIGLLGGYVMSHFGWSGFIAMEAGILVLGIANAYVLTRQARA